jgi:hypothetical protein
VLDEHGIDEKILIKSDALEYKEKIGSGATAVVYRGVWYGHFLSFFLFYLVFFFLFFPGLFFFRFGG